MIKTSRLKEFARVRRGQLSRLSRELGISYKELSDHLQRDADENGTDIYFVTFSIGDDKQILDYCKVTSHKKIGEAIEVSQKKARLYL